MTRGQKAYREFMRSAFWKELSGVVKARAGKCNRCGRKEGLQAHHRVYPEDWYETKSSDLEVLCRRCHAREHGKIFGGGPVIIFYRGDVKFSEIMHRIHCLHVRVAKGGTLRERDERFLDNAIRLYPPTEKDTCMVFQAGHLREMNNYKMGEKNE